MFFYSLFLFFVLFVGIYTAAYMRQVKKQKQQLGIVLPLFIEKLLITNMFFAFITAVIIGVFITSGVNIQ